MNVLLVPNVTTFDLKSNEDLFTSTLVSFINLCKSLQKDLKYEKSSFNDTIEYDIIMAMYQDDDIEELKNKYKGKNILEFYYDYLNGGWFLERVTIYGVTKDVLVETSPNSLEVDKDVVKSSGLYSEFYRVVINNNSEL